MKANNNEKGYALLLVLLLIVLITTITAVFLRGSISNAKQEKVVDQQHLKVTAAEAGVDYYKTLLLNGYFESLDDLDNIASEEIERQQMEIINKKRTSLDYVAVKSKVKDKLVDRLNQVINTFINKQPKELNNFYTFQIEKLFKSDYLTIDDNKILFLASVVGRIKNEEQTTALELRVTFYVRDYSGSPESSVGSAEMDIFNLYPDDSLIPACGSSKDIKNEKCKADRNERYEQIKNHSTVYFPSGYVKTSGDLDMKDNSKIYSKAVIGNNQLGFEAHKLVVKNSALFTHTGTFKAHELEVKNNGNFFINVPSINILGKTEFSNDSTVAIRGSGRFNDELIIKNNTSFCVDGSITVDGKFELKNNSKIYIFGVLNKQPSGDGRVINVGPTEVFNYCSLSTSKESVWPDPFLDVKYN